MDVLMPQLGETVAEGKISVWFKTVGDAVKPGENLFEIETDKVSMEVPATSAGVLAEIRVAAGEVAPVGAVVAVIADKAGARGACSTRLHPGKRRPPVVPQARPTPTAAMLPAVELRPAATLAPTHAQQRPVALDPFREVRTPERNFGPAKLASGDRHHAARPAARGRGGARCRAHQRLGTAWPHRRARHRGREGCGGARTFPRCGEGRAGGLSFEQVRALYRDTPHQEVALDTMRQTIAARLVLAKQTIPHFYLTARRGA